MRPIEMFAGAVRFSPLLLALDILLICHFAHSYYRHCYKKGYKVDYWHFTIFIGFVLPFLLLYPFAGSYFNVPATGTQIIWIREMVDRAYLITVTGYLCSYAGFYYYNSTKKRSPFYALTNNIDRSFAPYLYNIVDNKISLYTTYVMGLLLMAGFLFIAFAKYGMNFDLRGQTLSDPIMRPFFNFMSCVPVISSFILLRYLQYKEKPALISYLLITLVTLASGSRTMVFWPFLGAIKFYLIARRHKVNLLKWTVIAFIIVFSAFHMRHVRQGTYSPLYTISRFSYNVTYGNNFSDIRDFAWILTYWDNEYIMGNSYVAGLMSFVPRSLSRFRESWAISLYTSRLIGFDSADFPGLRPGKFGEAYLNFGIMGVIFLGFIGGYIIRYVDARIKEVVEYEKGNLIKMNAHTFAHLLIAEFYITAGFWSFYVFIWLLLMGYMARQLTKLSHQNRKANAVVLSPQTSPSDI